MACETGEVWSSLLPAWPCRLLSSQLLSSESVLTFIPGFLGGHGVCQAGPLCHGTMSCKMRMWSGAIDPCLAFHDSGQAVGTSSQGPHSSPLPGGSLDGSVTVNSLPLWAFILPHLCWQLSHCGQREGQTSLGVLARICSQSYLRQIS